MQQAIGIRDAVSPDEILFVVDSMLGQDAVNVAKAFKDGVGVTGVVLNETRWRFQGRCGTFGCKHNRSADSV